MSVFKAFMLYGRTKLAHGLLSGKYSVPVTEVCLLQQSGFFPLTASASVYWLAYIFYIVQEKDQTNAITPTTNSVSFLDTHPYSLLYTEF